MTFIRMLLAVVLLSAATHARAEELTAEKRADIEKLLEMTGAFDLGKQMAGVFLQAITPGIRQRRPDIPQKVLDVLPDEIMAVFDENIATFKAEVIPLYHKYYSAKDVKEMIAFYSTPLGQKTIRVMPTLMGESMTAGQKWGTALGPEINARVMARCKKEGYAL